MRRAADDLIAQTAPPPATATRSSGWPPRWRPTSTTSRPTTRATSRWSRAPRAATRRCARSTTRPRGALTDRIFTEDAQAELIPDTPAARLLVRGWAAMAEDLVLTWVAEPDGVTREELLAPARRLAPGPGRVESALTVARRRAKASACSTRSSTPPVHLEPRHVAGAPASRGSGPASRAGCARRRACRPARRRSRRRSGCRRTASPGPRRPRRPRGRGARRSARATASSPGRRCRRPATGRGSSRPRPPRESTARRTMCTNSSVCHGASSPPGRISLHSRPYSGTHGQPEPLGQRLGQRRRAGRLGAGDDDPAHVARRAPAGARHPQCARGRRAPRCPRPGPRRAPGSTCTQVAPSRRASSAP